VLLDFAKMHGLGNDFMVLDLVTQHFDVTAEQARIWADRRTGIGFDQLLLIEPPTTPDADFRFRIFNHDGSEVQQCGNGARCVASYVSLRQLSPKPELTLQTAGGPIVTRLQNPGDRAAGAEVSVEVDMGKPRTAPEALPFDPAGATAEDAAATYSMDLDGTPWRFTTVSMGNPHAVIMVDSVATAPVAEIGAALVQHPVFAEGANIGFCEVVDRGFVRLRVFERGVGETRACGTGACAAVVAARLLDRVGERVKVSLPGGKVRIAWQGPGATVRMTGPATLVYEGRIQP
jgi:diaminopimelate epimerase